MTEPRSGPEAARDPHTDQPKDAPMYAARHVVGIVDAPERAQHAKTALVAAGFADDEVDFRCGAEAGDALDASPGRTGLAGIAVRIAERLGIADGEMAMKDQYEQALRDGQCMVIVHAATEERKMLAARLLHEHGGHFIHYLGRLSIEVLHP
jgi:hypothetical protein